jgi:large subunit ribosomal protein L7/L12
VSSQAAPKVVKEGVAKAEAEDMKKKLEEAGAKVTLK